MISGRKNDFFADWEVHFYCYLHAFCKLCLSHVIFYMRFTINYAICMLLCAYGGTLKTSILLRTSIKTATELELVIDDIFFVKIAFLLLFAWFS